MQGNGSKSNDTELQDLKELCRKVNKGIECLKSKLVNSDSINDVGNDHTTLALMNFNLFIGGKEKTL